MQALFRSQFKGMQEKEGGTRQDKSADLNIHQPSSLHTESVDPKVVWIARSLNAEVRPLQYEQDESTHTELSAAATERLTQITLAFSKAT